MANKDMKRAPVIVDQHGKALMNIGSSDSAHYGASYGARELRGWNPSLASADSDLIPELDMLNARSIDLHRNNGVAFGAQRTSNDNVVGTGLNLSPKPNFRVLGRDSEWASEWSKDTKAKWNNHAESRFFDAAGRDNFHLQSKLIYNTDYVQGAAIGIPMWKTRPGSRYRTCIKVIDPARLSNPNNAPDTVKIRGGIERDKDGEPVAYWIRNTHPNDNVIGLTQAEWTRIPSVTRFGRRRFIHVYEKDRPGQSTGKARATAVLAAFGMAGRYQITELQAAIVNSKIAGFIESNMSATETIELFGGDQNSYTVEDYVTDRNAWKGNIDSGSILQIPLGDKFNSHVPNRPATAYADYMERIAREIGAGIGLPYELIMRDFSKTNYSSARAALLEAWRGFNVERASLAYQWANACYELWLEEAVDKGDVEAPDFYNNRAAYCRADWLGLGHQPIDPLKHQKAITESLNNRSTSLQRVYAEQGLDWEEELHQIAREEDLMEELGLAKAQVAAQLTGAESKELEETE